MNRNFALVAMMALSAALVPGLVSAQEAKIGLVDFNRCQKGFYRKEEVREEFEAKQEEERKKVEERAKKGEELDGAIRKAIEDAKDPTISPAKREELETQFQELQGQMLALRKEIAEISTQANADLAKTANDVQRDLTKEIYDVIGEIAAAAGYDVVLNRTFGINGVPTVAFSSTANLKDITDEVLAKLNADAPAGWKPPTE